MNAPPEIDIRYQELLQVDMREILKIIEIQKPYEKSTWNNSM